MAEAQRVIATSAIISVGVGSLNSVVKYGRPPTMRFIIGSGVAYLALSALSEGEPEVAKALAIAVATTVVLGEGDGVFAYINKYGEADTKPGTSDPKQRPTRSVTRSEAATALPDPTPTLRRDTIPAMPGIPRIP